MQVQIESASLPVLRCVQSMLLQSHQPNIFSLCASAEEIGGGDLAENVMLAWKTCEPCRGAVSLHLLPYLDEHTYDTEVGGLVCAHNLVTLHKDYFLSAMCNDVAGFVNPWLYLTWLHLTVCCHLAMPQT